MFYSWILLLLPTPASQLQKNGDLFQILKSAGKRKTYPRISALNNFSKGILNFSVR